MAGELGIVAVRLPRFFRGFEVQQEIPASRIYVFALVGGALLWLGAMALSGRAEAWDSPLYWKLAYPLALLLAGVLGYLKPERAWRWGLAVLLVQPAVMLLTSGSSFALLPLGLILFAILAIPAMLAARLGARMRLRSGR